MEERRLKAAGLLEPGDTFYLDGATSLPQRVLSTERDSNTDTVLVRYKEAGLTAAFPMCIHWAVTRPVHIWKTPEEEGRTGPRGKDWRRRYHPQ